VVIAGKRPPIPDNCPPNLKKLIQDCWNESPEKRPSFQQILESHVLDDVIVDAIISEENALGRQFWKENFASKEEIKDVVEWKKFIVQMVKWCDAKFEGREILDERLEVKAFQLVAADKQGMVTLENFSRVLEWFGPFSKGRTFIDNVKEIISIPGFFGDISTKEAEQVMAGKKPGQFIIRFSTQQPGFYTITAMADDNTLKHYRIKHKAGLGFLLGNQEYSSLGKLIKKHRKDLFLKSAVRGSQYSQLFVAHDNKHESAYIEMMV